MEAVLTNGVDDLALVVIIRILPSKLQKRWRINLSADVLKYKYYININNLLLYNNNYIYNY